MSEHSEGDLRDEAAAMREHERRAQEHDDAERAPSGEDEAGTADVSVPDPDADDPIPPPRQA
jgi:hypothetical protein